MIGAANTFVMGPMRLSRPKFQATSGAVTIAAMVEASAVAATVRCTPWSRANRGHRPPSRAAPTSAATPATLS